MAHHSLYASSNVEWVVCLLACLLPVRWIHKKVKLAESTRLRRKVEAEKAASGEVDEEDLARQHMQQLIKDDMGVLRYYLTPWNRIRAQTKIEKRKDIEAKLEEKEAQGVLEDEEDINLEIS